MAHDSKKRRELRGLYVYKRLPMEAACGAMALPRSTANRWKREAATNGDDWDKARAAVALGDDGVNGMVRQLIEDYLVQHQSVMDLLRQDDKLPAAERARILAGAADSFNKTISAFRKLSPELNRHAIALDALQRLATFAQSRYPKHVPALLEMLEPFGEELAKAYG